MLQKLKCLRNTLILVFLILLVNFSAAQPRQVLDFNKDWKFSLTDGAGNETENVEDASWRKLDLPHDWSIELPFDKDSPTGTGGGALRGGLGWYRKTFTLSETDRSRIIFIQFDGVYRNSEVFINGHSLGIRPNGYISFRYDLTPYLKYGSTRNLLAVKVDNSQQPNSRWYSGSGIYRNTWLIKTSGTYMGEDGTYITTPQVNPAKASVKIRTRIANLDRHTILTIRKLVYDKSNKLIASRSSEIIYFPLGTPKHGQPAPTAEKVLTQATLHDSVTMSISNPHLWSVDDPYLYRLVTQVISGKQVLDETSTAFGIRYFEFNVDKGFLLNGRLVKIRGVCNHHDLGCLGTAVNKSALRRQLQILKTMGCNGIRTSHNPPSPELLDLCDEMGFIVMDEAFDMWKREKSKYDYHLDWDKWHKRDLGDQIIRDRNHPSVFIWSLGNEIGEQWDKDGDSSAATIINELVEIVKHLDDTRPTVTANNEINPWNKILQANATPMIGYNYNHPKWDSVFQRWGRKPFIVTESVSALQTRGHYDMPSDSIRRWPTRWDVPLTEGNADTTCSAYDNCSSPWGSTHEETLKVFEKYDHVSGMFVWTGFDYIGEPTPYAWPARSSYFGIIDLAGFPKDVYYMYQSQWTSKPVLHIFPHWNWKEGQLVDVWAYYNNADEVELFLNGKSLGTRTKKGDDFHVMWRVKYTAGKLKAISRKNGKIVLVREIKTAGEPARLVLEMEHKSISAGKNELSFVKIKIVDQEGNLVPDANNLVKFTVTGGDIAGVDNGSQTSMESFKNNQRKAFNGLCLAVLRPGDRVKQMSLTARAEGLKAASVTVVVR